MFFTFHTAVLPFSLLFVVIYHFWRVRKAGGVLIPESSEKPVMVPVMPNLVYKEFIVALVLVAVLFTFSALFNAPLLEKANPAYSMNPTKAPWYFAGVQELLMHFHPFFAAFIIPLSVFVFLAWIPFLNYAEASNGHWFISEKGEDSSKNTAIFKNTVRFNVTNPLIFGDGAWILGYERTIGEHQSFSVNIGRASFPEFSFINYDSADINLKKDFKDKGFNFSADYRFYPVKENKYRAPRGVYFGPFYSYNYFNRINQWTLNTNTFQGNVETDLSLNMHTVGIELGYQFVFWKRLSVDLILLGPGVSFYNIKAEFNTTLSADDESLFFDKLNELLKDKLPGYDQVITGSGFKETGTMRSTTFGFRYMIMVGFRF
ncbi:MAG: DUF3575 domain-containing protein [Bacteroidales bacterium]|nr:DUF3575 domain-containing protein [Bacteroidales bacterium]